MNQVTPAPQSQAPQLDTEVADALTGLETVIHTPDQAHRIRLGSAG